MIEKHHIIKRSQCSCIDYLLNYKQLTPSEHRGENGVHGKNGAAIDLEYKQALECDLRELFHQAEYSIEDITRKLLANDKQVQKAFKKVKQGDKGYSKENIIKTLLGGRYYV